MSRRYKRPPVVEALCEFQFIPGGQWDQTLPGLIYVRVKKDFPVKKQQIGVGIHIQPTQQGIEHKIEPAPPRIQFLKEDQSALIQIAPFLLVVNQLKPYIEWVAFKEMVLKNFEIYREVVPVKGFKRIRLRYINVVEFDREEIELEDYFQFYPNIPEGLPQPHGPFLSRVTFPYEDAKEDLIVTLATVTPGKYNGISILLDLDYVMGTPEFIPLEGIRTWLDQAHERIEEAFEGCITDRARAMFEEVRDERADTQ